jgi:enterochelin esterase-like enzyme
MTEVPRPTRRDMLRYGTAAIAGVAGVSAFSTLISPARSTAEPEPPAASAPAYLSGSFISAARGGVETRWAIAKPAGETRALRPVIALHGRDGNAVDVMDLGVQEGLAEAMKVGWPPFAVVSVDGGNGYWHRRASGEDAGAMVLHELLPMLASQGLDVSRVAFMGWSMGGYGALRLGALLGPGRTAAICAVSPALWTSYLWTDPGAFDSYDDWSRNSVFGLPELSTIPVRVDCGTSDRFCLPAREFITTLRSPPAGGFYPGGHDAALWKQLMAAELTWVASHLTA